MDESVLGMWDRDGGMLVEVRRELIKEGKKDKGVKGLDYWEKVIGWRRVGEE